MSRHQLSLKLKVEDAVILGVVRLLQGALRLGPRSWSLLTARTVGTIFARVSKRRHLAYQNLRAAFGEEKSPQELRRIVRECYANLAMSMAEFLLMPYLNKNYFKTNVRHESSDLAYLEEVHRSGRGMIFLTGHFGNWELSSMLVRVNNFEMDILVRSQKHPRSDDYLNNLRSSWGARVITRGMNTRELIRNLKNGGVAGILADQDAGKNGVWAPLFNRLSSCPRGVGNFAHRTGSAVIPIFLVREDMDKHRAFIGREISYSSDASAEAVEEKIMQGFCRELEKMARAYPSQWLWAHRRWKSTPTRTCLILDDGRKGHLNQSVAFCDAYANKRTLAGIAQDHTRSEILEVRYRSGLARRFLTVVGFLTLGRFPFGMWFLKRTLTEASFGKLERKYGDLVISCGTGTEAVNLILARENGAKSCYIQKPQYGQRRFSVVLVPQHDRTRPHANTFRTVGALSLVKAQDPETDHSVRQRIAGLLVGGPSRHGPWDQVAFEKMLLKLRSLLEHNNMHLMATTSRRTDPSSEDAIRKTFQDSHLCQRLVIANETNPPDAYQEILTQSDLLIVTLDSISMISEAVSTGKPVLVLRCGEWKSGHDKLKRFLQQLAQKVDYEISDIHHLEECFATLLHSKNQKRPLPNARVVEEAVEALL